MNATTGTGRLVKLALRREKTLAPWWILLLCTMALVMVGYIERTMPTPEAMAAYVELINRSAFLRSLGGSFVVPGLGFMASWRSGGFLYVINGLAAVLIVVRHTRADEDSGRAELLRAGRIGRSAALTTALLVAGGVSLAGGVLPALALVATGLDPAGSIAYGAAITAAGWVFAAVAAVSAQLARTARTARAIGLTVLGVAYLLRYAGDATGQYWMKYLSPIGWSHLVVPYWGDHWGMLAVSLTAAVVLSALAYRLAGSRDLGEGLIPERLGHARAPGLRGPISLSWRLNRGLLIKWAAATGGFAAAAGLLTNLLTPGATPPSFALQLVEGFGGKPGATYLDNGLWAITLIFAYVIALYPVLMIQRLRAEETSSRAEALQATPVTRLRWAAGHLVVTGLGTAALSAVTGLLFGAVFSLIAGRPPDILRVLAGAMGTVPAAWLIGAICTFAYGLVPRAAVAISWTTWIATVVLGRIAGPLYGLWGGTPVEPFHYIPNTVAGAPFDPLPATAMLTLSTLLLTGGLLALRRRDFG
ncbi:ABC transporter permease [Amycolatopsis pigmentata]|uniref:ABC transporter permease n=1 Tax=Amycolatopsis pigmentata TaxID=450801 RepID=A0ABW5FNR7_9PSEU